MKAKVVLRHSVTLFVEGESEDQICDWLSTTTPDEALQQAKAQTGNYVEEYYEEEVECFVSDNSIADLSLIE